MSAVVAPPRPRGTLVVVGMIVWFAMALLLAAAGVFATTGPPFALATAAVGPPLLVVGLLTWSDPFRGWVETLDLRFLTMLQMWRVGGYGFLTVWAVDELPAGFALPAGFGDVAVGVTAPLVALHLVGRQSLGWRRGGFYAWTTFGVLDLVAALTLGALYSPSPIGVLAGDGPDTAPMAQLPLSLVPTFAVPVMLSLHVASVHLARRGDLQDRASRLGHTPHAEPANSTA